MLMSYRDPDVNGVSKEEQDDSLEVVCLDEVD